MSTEYGRLPGSGIEPAAKLLRAAIYHWQQSERAEQTIRPTPVFVTVSRQPGTGADRFSHRLADRLNGLGDGNWSAWDRELIEKVSAEHRIAKSILEMIEDRPHSWLDSLLQSLSPNGDAPDDLDLQAYKKVMMTIRALATAGHTIVVGRGGVFVTHGMPGGIHLRLVAPLDHRIKYIAERDKLSLHEAAQKIVDTEQKRRIFYEWYWPGKAITPEIFTLTLNAATLSTDELVECVLPIIRTRESSKPESQPSQAERPTVTGGAICPCDTSASRSGAA